MRIGYARVSTDDQNLDLQQDALGRARVDKSYEDKASGKSLDRPQLAECLRSLRKGDTLIVWRLDRLGSISQRPGSPCVHCILRGIFDRETCFGISVHFPSRRVRLGGRLFLERDFCGYEMKFIRRCIGRLCLL